MNLQKNIKSYSVRFCKDRDASFWDKINLTKDADVVYLPVWEEELEAEMPKEKYILKEINIDDFIGSGTSKDNIRLTKAYLYRNIIRYFRSLGCPCKKDFIGGVEVYINEPSSEGNNYWRYQRYSLTLRYDDQIKDGWQLDVAQGSKAIVGKTPTYLLESLQDEHFNVIAGTMILRNSEIGQY